jgi:hypothetical protein
MAQTRQRSKTQGWIADFIVAGVLALIVTFFLTDWLGDRACAEIGGTMIRSGSDALCETPSGTHTESSLIKGSSILYLWLAATAVFLVFARWFINRNPVPKA